MDINIFDKSKEQKDRARKYINLRSYIFIANSVSFIMLDDESYMFNINYEKISHEDFLALSKLIWYRDNESLARIDINIALLPLIKKVKQMKHKTKEDLYVINGFQQCIKYYKQLVKEYYEGLMENYLAKELLPFHQENILRVPFMDLFSSEKSEDPYIQPICDAILNREYWLGFDETLYNHFDAMTLEETQDDGKDFIKIPFIKIPIAIEMPYKQIKYTRNELQPALKEFNTHLNQLRTELSEMEYVPENLERIKELCRVRLLPLQTPLQQSLDDSLYLSHLMKQNEKDTRSQLFIGISTADMLIEYFEIMNIIEPYVASEVRNRIGRHINLMSTQMFLYLEVHPDNQVDMTDEDD